jgi:hypothetical protein
MVAAPAASLAARGVSATALTTGLPSDAKIADDPRWSVR